MHLNYYFLRQVTKCLRDILPGMRLGESFTQHRDEWVGGFYSGEQDFYIRALLSPEITHLGFPEQFNRARQNTVDLFSDFLDKEVTDVVQHDNERSFYIAFGEGDALMFKLHGNRSNLIMYQDEKAQDLFHHQFEEDLKIDYRHADRLLDTSYQAFKDVNGSPKKFLPTLGNLPVKYLKDQGYEDQDLPGKWEMLQEVLQVLEAPAKYYIILWEEQTILSLLKTGDIQWEGENPLEAANEFVRQFTRRHHFEKEKQALIRKIRNDIKKTNNYIKKNEEKLASLDRGLSWREQADIVMANLHQISGHQKEVELYDFYHDQQVTVKLDPNLSPQKNAEKFYQKEKNRKTERETLEQNILKKEEQKEKLEALQEQAEHIDDIRELRKFAREHGYTTEKKISQTSVPYYSFSHEGFDILVGKSAEDNDQLLRKYARKEDLWFHARDVRGSHVVLKKQPGKDFTDSIKEMAAALAAGFSKGQHDSLCPVMYTRCKYVSKPRHAAAGQVKVKFEDTLLVEPRRQL